METVITESMITIETHSYHRIIRLPWKYKLPWKMFKSYTNKMCISHHNYTIGPYTKHLQHNVPNLAHFNKKNVPNLAHFKENLPNLEHIHKNTPNLTHLQSNVANLEYLHTSIPVYKIWQYI